MADCVKGITKSIISNCTTQTVGGLEIKAWVGNRLELIPTYDNTHLSKIIGLDTTVGGKLFPLNAVKKMLNSGHDRVVEDARADTFTHYFNFHGFEWDSASAEDLDSLDDIVVIVETKDKRDDADGTFRVYGMKHGLYPSSDSARANDIGGARNIEVTSQDGEGEPFSRYNLLAVDYATTKALLEGLE